jgi:nicotinate-nucleotide adenylyltransferase
VGQPTTRRSALFGGTFDPIHNAHLEIARVAADRFDLARVLFVPAANPPHKPGGAAASFADRARMADLACAIDARFKVSRIEEKFARSYSILTIERLKARGIGPLSFLIGADAFREIQTWHRWQDVVAAVEFIVVARPGASWEAPRGAIVRELTGLDLPQSSSEIRTMIARGYWGLPVPPPVMDYIRQHGLYGSFEDFYS